MMSETNQLPDLYRTEIFVLVKNSLWEKSSYWDLQLFLILKACIIDIYDFDFFSL